jgi:hypothetical protein
LIPSTALSLSPILISWIALVDPSAIVTRVSAIKHHPATLRSRLQVADELRFALQDVVDPLFTPAHVHDRGHRPTTVPTTPALHRPDVGALVPVCPCALPQTPLMTAVLPHDCVVIGLG